MKKTLLTTVSILVVVASGIPALADSTSDAIGRLEAKLDALAKENTSLRTRLNRIEQPRVAAVVPNSRTATDATPNVQVPSNVYAASYPVKAVVARTECAAQWWQGGYVGINAGAVKHIANRTDQDAFLNTEAGYVSDNWGGIVGANVGYNFAKCNTLWGIEIDGSWASVSKTLVFDPSGGAAGSESLGTRMNAFASARLRAGVALDNMLLYVTGGLAAARFRTTWEDVNGGATPLDVATISESRLGWVAGFGTEWAWTSNLSVKSEVLYANFPDREHRINFPAFGAATFTHSDSVWISRIGLNYKLGGL